MDRSRGLRDFSFVVGRIYDAAADSALWPEVFGNVCALLGAAAGTLYCLELPERRAVFAAELGAGTEFLRRCVERYAARTSLRSAPLACEVGAVFQIRRVVDACDGDGSRFYREWAVSQGYGDLLAAILQRDEHRLAAVGLARRDIGGPYDDADVEAFTLIGRHLQRALQMSDLFAHSNAAGTIFESLLGHFAAAVILIDEHGKVGFANVAARQLLEQSRAGRIVDDRLVLSSLSVAEIARGVRDRQAFVAALKPPSIAAAPLGLTALAVRGAAGQARGAWIAIFISGEQTAVKPPPALLANMYGLTRGELRILCALLDGNNPDTVADQLDISVTTVRTHLTRLFAKTGSTGQVDLVRKVSAGVSPIHIPTAGSEHPQRI